MKLNRIILPVASLALLLSGCYDEKMEWGRPDGYGDVTIAEMPLALAEQIANYDYIKNYATKYMPGVAIGLGLGADLYIGDEDYKTVADNNFQMFTTGNAMKHSSVVKSNGTLDFTTIDQFLAAVPEDIQIYGHNFIWHTQQQQTYLKSVIAPEQVIEVDQNDVCANEITNSDFETGDKTGWTGLWGNYTYAVESPGHNSNYAIHFTMKESTSVNYDCQMFWPYEFVVGETYAFSMYVKSDCNLTVQFLAQNSSTYGATYAESISAGSKWTYYSGEFTYSEDKGINLAGIQFGGTPGSNLWVDDFKFGKKVEATASKPYNYCTNGDFSDGTNGWYLNNGSIWSVTSVSGNPSGNANVLTMTSPSSAANAWDLQVISPSMAVVSDKSLKLSFYVKSDAAGKGRVSFSGLEKSYPWLNWLGTGGNEYFETSTDWQYVSVELPAFNDGAEEWGFNLDFGYLPDVTYYFDDIEVNEVSATSGSTTTSKRKSASPAKTRAGIYYVPKSAAEKRAALLEAMESWIKGMYEHLDGRVLNYDVINEPIADNHAWRGIGGNFMSGDTTPEETEDSGLKLNWDDGHFYWGYFIGEDYGVKAFEYARKYAPEGSHLFVNDYGLESSPGKLAALIEFVKYIDDNSTTQVDGIGTQMHVSTSITRDEIDTMFKTLAATGKLIRVTELDVSVGTTTPSTEELATQAEVYQMVFDSYRENVPTAQQSGITIWSLTDNSREHEYWLPKDAPNIFDAKYGRKHAYKGVCDGIAGYDISTDFDGTQWQ